MTLKDGRGWCRPRLLAPRQLCCFISLLKALFTSWLLSKSFLPAPVSLLSDAWASVRSPFMSHKSLALRFAQEQFLSWGLFPSPGMFRPQGKLVWDKESLSSTHDSQRVSAGHR